MINSCDYCETLREKVNNVVNESSLNTQNIKQHNERLNKIENNINTMVFSTIAASGSVITTLIIILFK